MNKNINWKEALKQILDTGMYIKLIDDKWCMMRSGSETIYYDAPTKEDLIEAYYEGNLKDFELTLYPTFPITLINIHLPLEPAQHERSYCLRQVKENEYSTCYYNESTDAFYYGHYFSSFEEAVHEFQIELNRQMERLSYHTTMFYKYRNYINKMESEASLRLGEANTSS
jgi:hypothetical protein